VFQFSAKQNDNELHLDWKILPGYSLYKNKISVTAQGADISSIKFISISVDKQDPNFGVVPVFHDKAKALISIQKLNQENATLEVHYQGCAETGLCYPPQKKIIALNALSSAKKDSAGLLSLHKDASSVSDFLQNRSLIVIVLTFFVLGLGLAFTPCVFPMLPILSSLIAGESRGNLNARRAFQLASVYVLGMAITYAIAGAIVGYFGARFNVQAWFQSPTILLSFASVFVLLALSMFGFYELQLPSFIRDRLHAVSQGQKGGRLVGVFIMGALSALIVSPCVSAPLAGTLVFISSTGNALLGGLALFALGLGMGAPLIAVSTTGGSLLPRAGNWMIVIKAIFGIGLLAVAILLVGRVVAEPISLALWGLLLAGTAVYFGAFEPAQWGWPRFQKTVALVLFFYAVMLGIGALTHQKDPLKPLGAFSSSASASISGEKNFAESKSEELFTRIKSPDELRQALATAKQNKQAVVIDFYADWCAECITLERTTFKDEGVKSALSNRTRLQFDLTESSAEQLKVLESFQLFGPPALIFMNAEGQEETALRSQGAISAQDLVAKLK
jgi:thiol:disulfide interchange protein DsbD